MNRSIENGETEIARLRDRVKELETILQSAAAAHDLAKDPSTPSQGRSPWNAPESLSIFIRTAVEQKNILESVLESVDVGVIVSNIHGEMMLFNAAAQRIVGIGPVSGTDNWSPRYGCYRPNGIDLFPTDELPLARALLGESVRDTPIFIRNDDVPKGTLVSASANPIRDPHGTLTGGVVLFRDITKTNANEIELARRTVALAEAQQDTETQKRLLESVLDSIDIAVTVSNKAGEFAFFNPAARQILGMGPVTGVENWSPQYGCYRIDGVTPYPADQLPLARALRGESVHNEELYIRNPETSEDVLLCITAKPFITPAGDFDGAVCVFRDITKEKVAQQKLELSEERFRAFMENLPAISFIKNNAGQYIYGNHAFFSYHATDVSELTNGSVTDYDLTQKESAEIIQEHDARVLAGETPLHVGEHLINFDGSTTWFSVYKFRLLGPTGEILLGGIAVDVTESREYSERLEADEKLLRKMIDLQERERLLVAHDLHDGFVQDVVGAKMLIEALKGQLTGRTDLGLDNHFLEISEALGRAIADARRLISELRPLVIDEEGVVEAIRYLIAEKRYAESMKITFVTQMGPARLDPLLEGNIYRIVQEALNNSERHSEAGTVAINLGIFGEMIELSVADDGKGFNLDQVPSERFGLRGMRERARLFGGKLKIASSPGKGTRIEAQLPVKAPSGQSTDAPT